VFVAVLSGGIARADTYRNFSEAIPVSGEPVGATWHQIYSSGLHSVKALGDSIFIAWFGEGSSGQGVYLTRSLDGGVSFETPVMVTDTVGVCAYRSSLALGPGGCIYLVWDDERGGEALEHNIYFAKSVDGGQTFGANVRVDDAGDSWTNQEEPAVAVDDSGRIYVVWLDERGNGFSGVFFSRSLDGGLTFEPHTELPNYETGWHQYGPSIVAFGDGQVCVSYVDERHVHPNPPMYVTTRYSSDAGATFGSPVPVDSCGARTMHTSLCHAGGDDLYVAWAEEDDYCWVAMSPDGAQTFQPGVQVNSDPAGWDVISTLTADSSGYVAVAWNHTSDALGYSESRDGGQTFLPMIELSGPEDRFWPTIGIDLEHTVYLAWTDQQAGDLGDIYFSKGMADCAGIPGDGATEPAPGRLFSIYPNPFTSEVMIRSLGERSGSVVNIYDLRGRLVGCLSLHGGYAEWDGCNEAGLPLAPGAYILKASPSQGRAVKVILTR